MDSAARGSLAGGGVRPAIEGQVERLRGFARRHRRVWPVVGLALAAIAAYHFTLLSLLDFLRLDTPLAYLPLLPLFTVWTAAATVERYRGQKAPIQDRQVDYLVGIPMLVAALLLITAVPAVWSTYYWSERPDVISLALFVSGAVVVFYGFNWFWRLRAPLLFLFLMWPALYLHTAAGILQRFSDATNAALGVVVTRLPVGVTSGGQPGLLSVHLPHGAPLLVSIGSACSGASSVLGFALIGSAVLLMVQGRRPTKFLWLAVGLGLTFALNVVRILSILALASAGHPSFALGGYHAVIGLCLFALATVIMVSALPLFRLQLSDPWPATRTKVAASLNRPRRGFRWFLPFAVFYVLTLLLSYADHDLRAYAAFADGTGAPTVEAFGTNPGQASTGYVQHVATYGWATQYFGPNSDFSRWAVSRPNSGGVVWADVVRTDDRGTLDAYNLQNCFLFHNYFISTSRRIDLGNGVTGLLLNYSDPGTKSRWATVSWAWPINYKGETYYERVALTSDLSASGNKQPDPARPGDGLRQAVISIWNDLGSSTLPAAVQTKYVAADDSLQLVAASLVSNTVHRGGR